MPPVVGSPWPLQIGGFYKKRKEKKSKLEGVQAWDQDFCDPSEGFVPHSTSQPALWPGSLWLINDLPPRFVHVCFQTLRLGFPPCCMCSAAARWGSRGKFSAQAAAISTDGHELMISTWRARRWSDTSGCCSYDRSKRSREAGEVYVVTMTTKLVWCCGGTYVKPKSRSLALYLNLTMMVDSPWLSVSQHSLRLVIKANTDKEPEDHTVKATVSISTVSTTT